MRVFARDDQLVSSHAGTGPAKQGARLTSDPQGLLSLSSFQAQQTGRAVPQGVCLCTTVLFQQKADGAEEERVGAGEGPGRRERGDRPGLSEPFPDQPERTLRGGRLRRLLLRSWGARLKRGRGGRVRGQSRGRPPPALRRLPRNLPGLRSHPARAAGRGVRTEGAGPRRRGGRGVAGRSGAPAASPTTKGGGARPAVVARRID